MNWFVDIGLIVATILGISLMLREDGSRLTRNEKIYAIVVGVAYFVLLGLLCKEIYDLSQFPAMEMQ